MFVDPAGWVAWGWVAGGALRHRLDVDQNILLKQSFWKDL